MRLRGNALFAFATLLVACNALLGIDERSVAEDDLPDAALTGDAGDASPVPDVVTDRCDGCSTVVAVAQGPAEGHACVLLADKTARCWGEAGDGRLGIGSAAGKTAPVAPKLGDITSIAVGGRHTCAIAKGEVFCWGANDEGQVTGNPGPPVLEPTLVAIGFGAPAVVAPGVSHTCAASSAGQVACWGRNAEKQLGQQHARTRPGFAIVAASPATALCSGQFHSCAASAEKVTCWGDRSRVELGDNVEDAGGEPLPVRSTFYAVDAGPYVQDTRTLVCSARHTCALVVRDSSVVCWGANDEGQLGIGSTTPNTNPIRSSKLYGSSAVAVGDGTTCVVHAGTLRCLGGNDRGQLGSAGPSSTALVSALEGVSLLAGARNHGCATQGEKVLCWGANDEGQLGPASAAPWSPTPVVVPLP